jgi:hypothetical protein
MVKLDEIKASGILSEKNICLVLGVIFGTLACLNIIYIIPSSILLVLSGIQSFEFSKKKKRFVEDLLSLKLKKYEQEVLLLKEEMEKTRVEFSSLKNKFNFSQMHGMK